jgi:hypothetical protein
MQTSDVVTLVRNGHKFVALSDASLNKLAHLRQVLAVVPHAEPVETSPHGVVSCDDDALVNAIYAAILGNSHQHTAFDEATATGVEFSKRTVNRSGLGRGADDLQVREVAADAEAGAVAVVSGASSIVSPHRAVLQTGPLPATIPTLDVPMNLAIAAGVVGAASNVALISTPLTDGATHRASIQIMAMPDTAPGGGNGRCYFGICDPDVVKSATKETGEFVNAAAANAIGCNSTDRWIALQWRAEGTALPSTAMVSATGPSGQPQLNLSTDNHLFVNVGDVITMETRPRPAAAAAARPNKYAAMMDPAPAGLVVDATVLINGEVVGRIPAITDLQPIRPRVGSAAAEDPKGARRMTAQGIGRCVFGVQLCAGAVVALHSLPPL